MSDLQDMMDETLEKYTEKMENRLKDIIQNELAKAIGATTGDRAARKSVVRRKKVLTNTTNGGIPTYFQRRNEHSRRPDRCSRRNHSKNVLSYL